jgi:hypothetical protein
VVQAADFGTLHDLPRRRDFDRPPIGRILQPPRAMTISPVKPALSAIVAS